MKNKVKFNIKNVHWAKKIEEGYATPIALPGAVSISLSPQGELTPFYADGVKYYTASSNNGYEGDLEVALIPDEFLQEILGEIIDENKVMFENANNEVSDFALGFDIDGDVRTTRFWFYNCTATRPNTESSTNQESKEPTTDTLTISCAPGIDGLVRAKTTAETTQNIHDDWFKNVYIKSDKITSNEEG